MRTDEQRTTLPDPLDGFVISGAWSRSVPTRPTGLEEFLALSPIPVEGSSNSDERDETAAGPAPSPWPIDGDARQPTHSRSSVDGDWRAMSTVVGERPFVNETVSETSPAPRTIRAESAALAAAEPRALVSPPDVLVEAISRTDVIDGREASASGDVLHALFDGGGLVDPAPWFSAGLESNPPRESTPAAPGFGFRLSESPTRPATASFDGTRWDNGWEGSPALIPRVDRLDQSSTEALEEIEARLSRVAAMLEEVVDRIGSTAFEPLSARTGGFRGRVDE